MAENSRRRWPIVALIALLILVLLLLLRCRAKPAAPERVVGTATALESQVESQPPATGAAATQEADEILTPATLTAPEQVSAGAVFSVAWTGPDNRGDYVTIAPKEAPDRATGSYRETKEGSSLELTAPIDPGAYELRYVTGRSHSVLGRAPVAVVPVGVTLDAAAEFVIGTEASVTWTGPNNKGDYITIVAKETPDGQYGNYTVTAQGSPLAVVAPIVPGEAEWRYMTGQGNKVLARRPVRILMAEVSLSAPDEAVAGSTLSVLWTGPNNPGDYVTVVTKEMPDGQYGNYTNTAQGSPLPLLMPIMAGEAELRYAAAQGNRVLGRRSIRIVAAEVTLSASAEATAGSAVAITWTGPDHPGDYITVVALDAADGHYGDYTNTSRGSPLDVKVLGEPGDAEIRYMTGQGGRVLARRPIRIVR